MAKREAEYVSRLKTDIEECAWRLVPAAVGRHDVPYSLVSLCLHLSLPESDFRALASGESPDVDRERTHLGQKLRGDYLPPTTARYWAWESPGDVPDLVRTEYVAQGLHLTLLQTIDSGLLLVGAADLRLLGIKEPSTGVALQEALMRLLLTDPEFALPVRVTEGLSVGTKEFFGGLARINGDAPWGGWSDPAYSVAVLGGGMCLRFPKEGGYGSVPFRYGERDDQWISPRVGSARRESQRK